VTSLKERSIKDENVENRRRKNIENSIESNEISKSDESERNHRSERDHRNSESVRDRNQDN
jgi:hypothetical protein